MFSVLLWIHRSGIVGRMVTLWLTFWGTCQTAFQSSGTIFHFYQQYTEVPRSLHPHPNQIVFISFTTVLPVGVKCTLWFGFAPNDWWYWALFYVLMAIHNLLWRNNYLNLCSFLNCAHCFLGCKSSLSWILELYQINGLQIFSFIL